MRWVRLVARVREKKGAYRTLVGKSRRKREDNIKIDLQGNRMGRRGVK
jgi:hypothetical protein